jgi:hypothetical protein
LLQYIPSPNVSDSSFSTGGEGKIMTTKAAVAWIGTATDGER